MRVPVFAGFHFVRLQPLNELMVLNVLYQCADGLHHLHTLCIIHRDVRADNVLVASPDPPLVLITDFGLAHKLQSVVAGVSASATVFGPLGAILYVYVYVYLGVRV